MISFIVLRDWCQTEELCIVRFQLSIFLAKDLISAIVKDETKSDLSNL